MTKYISNTPLLFYKSFLVFKMAVANKCLNGTTEILWDIKRLHATVTQTFRENVFQIKTDGVAVEVM